MTLRLSLMSLLFLWGINSVGQNLVPNPSFENLKSSICDIFKSQADFNASIADWTVPTAGTSDLFSSLISKSCFASTSSSVSFAMGSQNPRTGNIMAGVITYGSFSGEDLREYLQVPLTSPLIPGETYEVEFWVSNGEGRSQKSNNIGAYFSDNLVNQNSKTPLGFVPHVNELNIVMDSQNWQKVSGRFIATSSANFMIIGNFFSNSQTAVASTSTAFAYYFIDDVSVVKVENLCNDNDKDGVCDDVDLDDDNDGILDLEEGACVSSTIQTPNSATSNSSGFTGTRTLENTYDGKTSTFGGGQHNENIIGTVTYSYDIPLNNVSEMIFTPNGGTAKYDGQVTDIALLELLDVSGNVMYSSSNIIIKQQNVSSTTIIVFPKSYNGVKSLRLTDLTDNGSHGFNREAIWREVALNGCIPNDSDNDGIPDYLDSDSDNDGCLDAIEGGGGFKTSDLSGNMLSGAVDANGVPVLAGSNGQTVGSSQDKNVQDSECVVCTAPLAVVTTATSLHYCKGSNGIILAAQDARENATYEWFKNGVSVSSPSTNPIFNDATAGKWVVEVSLNNCSSVSMEVEVVEDPLPQAEITSSKLNYCVGENGVTLEAKDLGNDFVYEWFKDGVSQGKVSTNRIISNATEGTWEVKAFNPNFANPTLISQFDFNGNLNDTYNNSLCNPINLSSMNYTNGTLEWATTETSIGGGLQILIPDNLFTENDYIIEADFQFSTISNSWHKIWDFKDKSSDAGLYYLNGSLQLYPNQSKGPTKVLPNTNYNVVLTRDGIVDTAMSSIMFNGNFTNESSTRDNGQDYVPKLIGTNRVINIFVDDQTTNSEFCSSGKVSAIRIWNRNSLNSSCITSASVIVKESSLPVFSIGNDTTVCQGNDFTISAPLSGTYKWSTAETSSSIQVATSGSYSVEITDTNGCKGSNDVAINFQPCVTKLFDKDTLYLCIGDSLTIRGKNVTSQIWGGDAPFTKENDSTIRTSPSKDSFFYLGLQQGNNVENIDSILVIVRLKPNVDLGKDSTICKGDDITFSTNLFGTYLWNTNATSSAIKVSTDGEYSLEVTDDNGCKNSDTVKLKVIDFPQVNLGSDTTICKGDSLTLDAENTGLNFKWNTGSVDQQIIVSEGGIYGLEVYSNGVQCFGSDSIQVTVQELPKVNLGEDTSICEGVSVLFDAKNKNLSHNWSTGAVTQTITVNQAGKYHVTVKDAAGCSDSDTIVVSVNPMPNVEIGKDTAICIGNSILLDAQNSGFQYQWSTGETTQQITVTQTGGYEVRVFDHLGCADTSEIIVTVNELPIVNLGNDTVICEFEGLLLNAQNQGLKHEWYNGSNSQTLNVLTAGTYRVTVSDAIGCAGTDEIIVTKELIENPFLEPSKILCQGDTILLESDIINADNFYWEKSGNSTLEVFEEGSYIAYVESTHCRDTFEVVVSQVDTPMIEIIDLKGQDFYCFDTESTTLSISEQSGIQAYHWEEFGRTDEIEITKAGTYTLTASTEFCSVTFQKTVQEYCPGNIYIPNAFTPGIQDGINDIFLPITNGHVQEIEWSVFNRWGQLIFQTTVIGEGWDGTYRGKPVPTDVYVYQLRYSFDSKNAGEEYVEKVGTVNLLR